MTNLGKGIELDDTFANMDLDNDEVVVDKVNIHSASKQNQYYVYAIIDKHIEGLTQYFRDYGIKLSKVFTNIESARSTLIMQTEPVKLIIIDTGSGRFASMAARKSLVDLIGIGDDSTDIMVFYTDSIIKNEVSYSKDINSKDIKWSKFISTPQVLATLLQEKGDDIYVLDSEYIDIHELKFSRDSRGLKDNSYKYLDVGSVQIGIPEITTFVAFKDENSRDKRYNAIEAFEVEI